MNEQEEIQVETFHRQAPKTGTKNFGSLQRGTKKAATKTRIDKVQGRQYFDSAEYSLHKGSVMKEDIHEHQEQKTEIPEQK